MASVIKHISAAILQKKKDHEFINTVYIYISSFVIVRRNI